MELRNALFFTHVFSCKSKEGSSLSKQVCQNEHLRLLMKIVRIKNTKEMKRFKTNPDVVKEQGWKNLLCLDFLTYPL